MHMQCPGLQSAVAGTVAHSIHFMFDCKGRGGSGRVQQQQQQFQRLKGLWRADEAAEAAMREGEVRKR